LNFGTDPDATFGADLGERLFVEASRPFDRSFDELMKDLFV
jgi:hypothetical protein